MTTFTMKDHDLTNSLDSFVTAFIQRHQQHHHCLPHIDYDPQWPSECYQQTTATGEPVPWVPVLQQQTPELFQGLAHALETDIHPDIVRYYTRYWSDPLPASFNGDRLNLLFVWNDEDYERLRGNLIGHALTQRRRKLPLTLFFACTEPEDFILSVDNASGQVMLEQPGQAPLRVIAESLAAFIGQLKPEVR